MPSKEFTVVFNIEVVMAVELILNVTNKNECFIFQTKRSRTLIIISLVVLLSLYVVVFFTLINVSMCHLTSRRYLVFFVL